MRVLLFCDEFYHPGDVAIGGVAPLKDKRFEFDIIKKGQDFDPKTLTNYSVVLMAKCPDISPEKMGGNWKTPEVQQAFVEYIENGGGMLVVHNGTVAGDVSGENTEVIDKLIGCRFKWHPNDCPVTVEPIKPHPVTKNVESFCEVDEHYYLEILADDIDIVMASYAPQQGSSKKYAEEPYFNVPAKLCTSGYVRTQGKGRICVLASGHHLDVWLNPNFQQVLENALNWCGFADV